VTLPLEEAFREVGAGEDPLAALREHILRALRHTAGDEQTRRVFEVATLKVEYVDEMGAVRSRHVASREQCLGKLQQALRSGAKMRDRRLAIPAAAAAHGLHALLDGLIQNWLLDPAAFDLVRTGEQTVDCYLAGLGLAS
jgi:TetR/AcrR family acrAB operon transcriptional repressor